MQLTSSLSPFNSAAMSQSDGADEEICTPKPAVRNFTRRRWGSSFDNINPEEFHTVDGVGKIVTRWGWGSANGVQTVLEYGFGEAMTDVQHTLIAGGDDPQDRYRVEIGRDETRRAAIGKTHWYRELHRSRITR